MISSEPYYTLTWNQSLGKHQITMETNFPKNITFYLLQECLDATILYTLRTLFSNNIHNFVSFSVKLMNIQRIFVSLSPDSAKYAIFLLDYP